MRYDCRNWVDLRVELTIHKLLMLLSIKRNELMTWVKRFPRPGPQRSWNKIILQVWNEKYANSSTGFESTSSIGLGTHFKHKFKKLCWPLQHNGDAMQKQWKTENEMSFWKFHPFFFYFFLPKQRNVKALPKHSKVIKCITIKLIKQRLHTRF